MMVAKWKLEETEAIKGLLSKYPVIGIANIEGIPAPQFQEIREKTKGQVVIRVTRKRLLKRAIEESKPELKGLIEYMDGPIAVVFSDVDAFRLYNNLKGMKSMAPVKAGQIASQDIVVPAGDTGLPPGPALGDLKAAGINAKIEGSTIKVLKDSVVAKKGDVIKQTVANALNKLGVKPREIFLKLSAVYDNGMIFKSEVLDIDEERIVSDIRDAYKSAFNLAANSAYPAKPVVDTILMKASTNARNLALEIAFPAKQVISDILGIAHMHALSIKSLVDAHN